MLLLERDDLVEGLERKMDVLTRTRATETKRRERDACTVMKKWTVESCCVVSLVLQNVSSGLNFLSAHSYDAFHIILLHLFCCRMLHDFALFYLVDAS